MPILITVFGSFLPSLGLQQPKLTRVEEADMVMKLSAPCPSIPAVERQSMRNLLAVYIGSSALCKCCGSTVILIHLPV